MRRRADVRSGERPSRPLPAAGLATALLTALLTALSLLAWSLPSAAAGSRDTTGSASAAGSGAERHDHDGRLATARGTSHVPVLPRGGPDVGVLPCPPAAPALVAAGVLAAPGAALPGAPASAPCEARGPPPAQHALGD